MKKVLVGLGLVILIGLVVLCFLVWQKQQWQVQKIDQLGVSLMLRKPLKLGVLSEEDAKIKILFRAKQDGDQPLLITLRYEDGLRLATSLSHQDLIPMLLGNIDKAYPKRFQNYTGISSRQLEISSHKAAELIFTYDGPAGEKVKQRFLIVDLDGNRAFYLATQAKVSDFDQLNKKYFNRLFTSLSFE